MPLASDHGDHGEGNRRAGPGRAGPGRNVTERYRRGQPMGQPGRREGESMEMMAPGLRDGPAGAAAPKQQQHQGS